jgi:hypothetical protein
MVLPKFKWPPNTGPYIHTGWTNWFSGNLQWKYQQGYSVIKYLPMLANNLCMDLWKYIKKSLESLCSFRFLFPLGYLSATGQIFEFQTQYPVTKLTLGNAMTTVRLQNGRLIWDSRSKWPA